VYREFQKARGLDGSELVKYYQPNQGNLNRDRFNRIELWRLKSTVKRGDLDWRAIMLGTIGGIIGLAPINAWPVIFVNGILFWLVFLAEVWFVNFRSSPTFLYCLLIVLVYSILNQVHVFWKTRDSIELSKLTERSMYLEIRICSTVVNYIKANIVFAFLIRWCFENNYIVLSGVEFNSIWNWIAFAVDNMLFLLAFLDYGAVLGYSGISSIRPVDTLSYLLLILIIFFNHFAGLDSIKAVLEVLEAKGKLRGVAKAILWILKKFM
jgi:hypothetical protein